ncbi:rhamnan synthesis F family protein [Cellulomonas taurus]|uniref:rhamnan synthesis F family protein n=1 Tax=Cellulomonas taurus TaxID=2729175 RepID=UPI00145DE0AC|nr:rhamnan synthesis F family protein [Cellulomonas taurus]
MTLDLDAHGYRRQGSSRLWVRSEAADAAFGYNDGDDFENWVASAVHNATDVSSLSREVEGSIRDWPSRYHLSHRRANLIRPLLDTLTGPVLEIGAGMGAVTRGLGEAGLEVVAVEGSPRRASVCAERVRDLDNVQVVADTVQGFGVPRRFPTIVMVGVLEYSRVFGFESDGRDPVDVMLDHLVSLLEPGGTLVLAIENQLGLKYFAGFPEDHVGRRMFGIEDHYTEDGVVTFGREELGRHLTKAGLTHHDWYYPFPDYKLPTTVLSEAALDPAHGFDPTPLVTDTAHADFQEPATIAIDPELAWGPVIRNGLLRDLSNSFLVRASAADLRPAEGLAWYYGSASRRPEFAKATHFTAGPDGVVVHRQAARPTLPHTVGDIAMTLEEEVYTPGVTAADRLIGILRRDAWRVEHVTEWFGTWLGALRAEAELPADATGDSLVPGRLLDALPRNLMHSADGDRFFDLEWSSSEDLTLSYLVFRALYDSLASQKNVAAPATGTSLVVRDLIAAVAAAHGIRLTEAVLAAHWARECDFQSTVLGAPVTADAHEVLGIRLTVRVDLDAVIADHERLPVVTAQINAERAAERTAWQESAAALEEDRLAAHAETEKVRAELAAALGSIDGLHRELAAQQETLSWQVTAPLRSGRTLAGRVKRRVERQFAKPTPPPAPPAPEPEPVVTDPSLNLAYYRERYPDIAALSDADLTSHWQKFGRDEGRHGQPLLENAHFVDNGIEPSRQTVMLVLHEATRTGAPVLGWNLLRHLSPTYNVVVVLLKGGELAPVLESEAAAMVVFDGADRWEFDDSMMVAADLVARYRPLYAIANSGATYPIAPALERSGVPVVSLVHEFASSIRPAGVMADTFHTVSEVVFSAPMVSESMRREYADLTGRGVRVIPQGPSELPAGAPVPPPARPTRRGTDGALVDLPEQNAADLIADLGPDTVLVLGAGTIAPRKGVEFFLQAADQARRSHPDAQVVFAWVGERVPALQWYIEELHEQVLRTGTEDRVAFLAPVADLGPLFERADLFLLSSRLDPLPNVTIDAALAGVPVVAFDGASGFAEWLATDDTLRTLVVPHLDATAAGDLIGRLAEDSALRHRLGDTIRAAAGIAFDLADYVRRIDELGHAARARREQEESDVTTILADGDFDPELYTYAGHEDDSPEELVRDYVHRSALAAPRARARAGILVRRPAAGFHPLAFAERAPDYDDTRDGDPYAVWLRRGRPAGPWHREVIRPGDATATDPTGGPSILVHGHFHYPELLDDLLPRLADNTRPYHLAITTGSDEAKAQAEALITAAGVESWEVLVTQNRGRDLAPLLTGLGTRVLDYDLVLHVHGKKSPHTEVGIGDRWREFLYANLVGGRAAMLDEIHAAFAADPELGLVSPEDPHLNDWDLNREFGEQLAARFGVDGPLPTHFDFPLGTMFWARTEALRPMLEAGLVWEEYPAEPLPIDGTALHALERLIPFVVESRGFRYAKTQVPGVQR